MASKMTKNKPDKIEYRKLSEFDTESFENARTGAWATAGGDDETNSFEDLIKSIQAKGQTTPVFARPNTGAKAKKQPLQAVAGFRRLKAFATIAERAQKSGDAPDDVDPIVKVIVRDLNDYEARALNLEENTARDNLTGPDLAWAIHDLSKLAIAAGMPLTDIKLAEDQGISQAYGNRLLRIMRNVSPKITTLWRKAPIALTVPEMDSLASDDLKNDPAKQLETYNALVAGKGDPGKPKKRGPGAWVDTAEGAAAKVGAFLAFAEEDESLTLNIEFNSDLVGMLNAVGLVKYGKNEPTQKQLDKVALAMENAYNTALDERDKAEALAAEKAAAAAAKAEKAEKPAKGKNKSGAASATAATDN